MNFAVLGNTPELSALELGVPYSGGQVEIIKELPLLERLGGTVKVGHVIGQELAAIYEQLQAIPTDHKLVFGFSIYAGDDQVTEKMIKQQAKQLLEIGLGWKKELKQAGRSVRLVVSNEPSLSSVIVTREHLLRDQTDFVVVLYQDKTIVGRTTAVQDYRTFSERDYGRPQRDHASGMLPPKVARMMINIAKPNPTTTILDPFCGSGTIVQEALQLGFKHVLGSDISQKCIDDTQANITWAKLPPAKLFCSDVLKLSSQLKPQSVDVVVSEGYLGPVHITQLSNVHEQLRKFYTNVFRALQPILKSQGRLVLALPCWRQRQGLLELPLDAVYGDAGFKQLHRPVYYGRPQARVMRKIIFLKKV